MSKVDLQVYNLEGEKTGTVAHTFFDVTVSDELLTQVMRVYQTNQHQGTKKAKTRGEVTGSDIKPWKQKGTGRARAGSRNSPIFVGGGVTFGPRPHTRRLSVPKKMKDKVMKYFIDAEVRAENFLVVKDADSTIKTKDAFDFLKKQQIHHRPVVIVLPVGEVNVAGSFRNVRNVKIRRAEMLSPVDMFNSAAFIITETAYKNLVDRVTKNEK
ncbi:MAG: 50S ribosomal protein L4 [Candidatus Dojkabacteria bacterium]|nr:MAG: 50S ribosomal protein L4 [Candidatus Dojkabacteria bacterium]